MPIAPFFNNGAAMDGIPRGSNPAAAAGIPAHRAKRGLGLSWWIGLMILRFFNG